MKLKSVGQFLLMVIASLILTGAFFSWMILTGESSPNFNDGGIGGGDDYEANCDSKNHNMVWVYYWSDMDEDGVPEPDARNEGFFSFRSCTEEPATKYQCYTTNNGPWDNKETPTTKCKNLMTQQALLDTENDTNLKP